MTPETTPRSVTAELSPVLRQKVALYLNRTVQSLAAKAGEKVKLICGHSVTTAVLADLPGSTLSWTLNTEPLTMDPSRMLYYKENLDITNLVPADSGVYTCVVNWGSDATVKQNLTLGFFSLEVETDSITRYVIDNEPTSMDCHSVAIGILLPDSIRYWLYNGTTAHQLPTTKADNKTVDVIANVHKTMSGVWECQVYHPRTERAWATAWYNLSVQPPPSTIAVVFRFLQINWYAVVVVISILVAVYVLVTCYSSYRMNQIEEEAEDQFEDQRSAWEESFLKYGASGKIDLDSEPAPTITPEMITGGKEEELEAKGILQKNKKNIGGRVRWDEEQFGSSGSGDSGNSTQESSSNAGRVSSGHNGDAGDFNLNQIRRNAARSTKPNRNKNKRNVKEDRKSNHNVDLMTFPSHDTVSEHTSRLRHKVDTLELLSSTSQGRKWKRARKTISGRDWSDHGQAAGQRDVILWLEHYCTKKSLTFIRKPEEKKKRPVRRLYLSRQDSGRAKVAGGDICRVEGDTTICRTPRSLCINDFGKIKRGHLVEMAHSTRPDFVVHESTRENFRKVAVTKHWRREKLHQQHQQQQAYPSHRSGQQQAYPSHRSGQQQAYPSHRSGTELWRFRRHRRHDLNDNANVMEWTENDGGQDCCSGANGQADNRVTPDQCTAAQPCKYSNDTEEKSLDLSLYKSPVFFKWLKVGLVKSSNVFRHSSDRGNGSPWLKNDIKYIALPQAEYSDEEWS